MSKISVKNLKKTGENNPSPTCSCTSLIDHCNKNRYPNNDKVAGVCRGCKQKFNLSDLNGGHVKKLTEAKHFIIPLCSSCNQKEEAIFSVYESDLVLANGDYCKTKK